MDAATERSPDAGNVEARHFRYFRDRGDEDCDWLVEHYQGLAKSLALRSARPLDDRDDLIQVAFVGLVAALDRFDPTRGVAFSTFAWATVSGELKRHQRDHTWDLRVSRQVQESYLRVAAVSEELTATLGRSPTVAEIAAASGEDEAAVIRALDARHARAAQSLDVPTGAGGSVVVDPRSEDSGPEAIDDHDLVRSLLSRLPDRDRAVVERRFYDRWSQAQISEQIGCSQMQVSRVLSHALQRLREMAALELAGVPRRSIDVPR